MKAFAWRYHCGKDKTGDIIVEKIKLEPETKPYPMSVFLVGVNVDGRPNFMTVAWATKVHYRPPIIAVSINKRQ